METAETPDYGPDKSQSREELEQELNAAHEPIAKLRHLIDAIPTLAWCNLPDGSNELLNQRWYDYTGVSAEKAQSEG